jgi:preprotein translocase subunit SecG
MFNQFISFVQTFLRRTDIQLAILFFIVLLLFLVVAGNAWDIHIIKQTLEQIK